MLAFSPVVCTLGSPLAASICIGDVDDTVVVHICHTGIDTALVTCQIRIDDRHEVHRPGHGGVAEAGFRPLNGGIVKERLKLSFFQNVDITSV